jgi:hypothetical protein
MALGQRNKKSDMSNRVNYHCNADANNHVNEKKHTSLELELNL